MKQTTARCGCACFVACVVTLSAAGDAAGAVKIPLTVRAADGTACPSLPVWLGVPLPLSAVKDAKALRLLGADGEPIPAQFDVEATWADGSPKWVLVSFEARGPVTRRRRPNWEELRYTLV